RPRDGFRGPSRLGLGPASCRSGLPQLLRPVWQCFGRMIRLLAPLRRGSRPAMIGRSAALLANSRLIAPDFAGRALSGNRIRRGFLAAGAALAGLLARGRGLRLGQGLFLGATAVADYRQKIIGDLV